jgi:hypothetical protein
MPSVLRVRPPTSGSRIALVGDERLRGAVPRSTLFWRTLAETDFDEARKAEVRAALRGTAPLNTEQWRAAARGDAPAAIGLALGILGDDARRHQLDVAMTAVLGCALAGDPAARIILSHALRTVSHDANNVRLATSWLVANLAWAVRRSARGRRTPSKSGALHRLCARRPPRVETVERDLTTTAAPFEGRACADSPEKRDYG